MNNRSALIVGIIALALAACRPRSQSDLSEQKGDHLFRTDFDWAQLDENKIPKVLRHLRFCFDKSLPAELRVAFVHAATKINATGVPDHQRWQLLVAESLPNLCQDDWDPDADPDSSQPQLRIRPVNTLGMPSLTGFAPYQIDDASKLSSAKPSPESEYIVLTTNNDDHKLGAFEFNIHDDYPGYTFFGEILINAAEDEYNDKLPWSMDWGKDSANITFDPFVFAIHMFGHVVRLQHDETLYPGTQVHPCGSYQANALNQSSIEAAKKAKLTYAPLGDDALEKNKRSIKVGDNGVVETTKLIPVMFPYLRLGSHCRNPSKGGGEDIAARVEFSPKEKEAIKASARHQGPSAAKN